MNQKKNPKNRRPARRSPKQPPRAHREFTAGGVVFRRHAGAIQILMIQDHKGRWTIPKGHVEPGESLEQTAVREVGEETGLINVKILDRLDTIHFFHRKEGKLIFTTTHVYLMEATANTDELVPEDSEGIADVQWFPQEQALELIEYKDTEKLFRLGLQKLAYE